MHRVILLTDLHLRSDYIPGYLDKQLWTLTKLVNDTTADSVVINGDIFHRRNPRGEELLAFRKLLKSLNVENIYINRGNHDTVAKDGSTHTTLSLYSDLAHVVEDYEQIMLGDVLFDFIPHYEDEGHIVKLLKKSHNPIFGHFGFDGCVSNGYYAYESHVKKEHFGNRIAFLGHIHKPAVYNNQVFILGTQYSTSFGEANAQKYLHELVIENGEVGVLRKPIDFGIRHVTSTIANIEDAYETHKFDDFFTILRIKLDKLDEGVEHEIQEHIVKRYKVNHMEVVFDDVLPKYESSHVDYETLLDIDDKVIDEYIDNSSTIFSKKELLQALDDIKNYEA